MYEKTMIATLLLECLLVCVSRCLSPGGDLVVVACYSRVLCTALVLLCLFLLL